MTLAGGQYLRLRRKAAGLSVDDVVMLITPDEAHWPIAKLHMLLIERGEAFPTSSELAILRTAYPFDRYVFRLLLGHLEPVPCICTACGCSDLDPCDDEIIGPCAWTTPARDFCTRCARIGAVPFIQEEVFRD